MIDKLGQKYVVHVIILALFFSLVSSFWNFQISDDNNFEDFLDGFSGVEFGLKEDVVINNPAVFSPEVLSKANYRNMDLYSDDLVFVALSSDHKAVFKATTLAIWNDDVGLHSYPLLVIHEQDIFSAKNFLKDNNIKKLVFVGFPELIEDDGSVPKNLADSLGIAFETLDYTDYKEYKKYWTSIVSVVGVVSSDYNNMLHASVFASSLNLPLVFLDDDNRKFNHKNTGVLLVGGFSGVLKSFERVLLEDSSISLESHLLFRDVVSSENVVLYNPDDIDNCVVVGGVFSGSDFVNSGFCRDSLLVPYLAVLHNQLVLPLAKSYKEDIFSLMDDLKNIKFKVNPSYVTFVGSPSAIPFGSDSIVARSLNPDGFVGVGRLLGVTVSDTSVLIMNSLKPVKFDSFFGYFNSIDLIGQAYVPPNVFSLENFFSSVKFSSTNVVGRSYIPDDNFVVQSKAVVQAVESDVLFIEGDNDLFSVDDKKELNSSVVFLVDDNSLNVESGVPFGFDLVRRGVRGVFGYPFQKVPSAEMKYFPLLFSFDFGEPVLFGDVNSLLNNFYLGNQPKSIMSLVTNDLLFIGDPLSQFLPQKSSSSKLSKNNPVISSFVLSDFPSQDSVLYGSYFDKYLSSSWGDSLKNIVVVNDLDVFDVSSIVFPLKNDDLSKGFTVFPNKIKACEYDSCSKFFSVVSLNPSAPFIQEDTKNSLISFPFKDSLPAFDDKLVFCVDKLYAPSNLLIKEPGKDNAFLSFSKLSAHDFISLKEYFIDDFSIGLIDCYVADLSLLKRAKSSFGDLLEEFYGSLFISNYDFTLSLSSGKSLSFSSPVYLAHDVSLVPFFGEKLVLVSSDLSLDDIVVASDIFDLDNCLVSKEVLGRLYRINNQLVVYMGNNVFFKYDLSTAFTDTGIGIVKGTTDVKLFNLLKEYQNELINSHNPLNYAVIEELYLWALSKTDRVDVIGIDGGVGSGYVLLSYFDETSSAEVYVHCPYTFINDVVNKYNAGKDISSLKNGDCTSQIIEDNGLLSDLPTDENGVCVVKEGYCCDCLIRSGLGRIFAGEYGGCNSKHKFSCYNGLEISWSLADIDFVVDIVSVDDSLNKADFTIDDPKLAKNSYYYKSFLMSDLDNVWMKNSMDYFVSRGASLSAHSYLFGDDKGADAFMSFYPRGAIIGEQRGGLGHMGVKADGYKTIEAHIGGRWTVSLDSDYEPGYNNGKNYDGDTYYNIIIHPSGSRSVLDDIGYLFP